MASMQQIKELREKTGAGLMDVRNALQEADGDMTKAVELLRQKGAATAEKKASRATGEGKVAATVLDNAQVGSLVEVNCETDFSANNERFTGLVSLIADTAAKQDYASLEALHEAPTPDGESIKSVLTDTIGAVKENMTIRRFERYALASGESGLIHAYIHAGGKIGVLLEVHCQKADSTTSSQFQAMVKDIAMQIAAFAPDFVSRSDIPASVIEEETRVEMGKEDIQKKPETIREKIVSGRVDKNLAQRVLLMQPFVKEPSQSVEATIQEQAKALDETFTVKRFVRYVLGEHSDAPGSEEQESDSPTAACSL